MINGPFESILMHRHDQIIDFLVIECSYLRFDECFSPEA
jgi:hypothetical protein